MPTDLSPLSATLEKTVFSLEKAAKGIDTTLAPVQAIGHLVGPLALGLNIAGITAGFMHDGWHRGESSVRVVADLLGEVAGGCIGSTLGFTGGQFWGTEIGMVLGGPLGAAVGSALGGIVGSLTAANTFTLLGQRVGDSIATHSNFQGVLSAQNT